MPLVDRLPVAARKYFTNATLKTAEQAAAKSLVTDTAFFRSAYSATVAEAGTRRYLTSFLVGADGGIQQARCSCTEQLRPRDLCRHLALAIGRFAIDDVTLMSQRFDASVWRAVGEALHEAYGDAIAHAHDERTITTSFRGAVVLTLLRPEVIAREFAAAVDYLYSDEKTPPKVREAHLRRLTMTDQEAMLLDRGVMSRRQVWESSFWYRLGRVLFEHCDNERAALVRKGTGFQLFATARHPEAAPQSNDPRHPEAAPQSNDLATDPKRPKDPPPCEQRNQAGGPSAAGTAAQVRGIAEPPQDDGSFLIDLPRSAVEAALLHDPALATRAGFAVVRDGVTPALRLSFDDAGNLHFHPLLQDTAPAHFEFRISNFELPYRDRLSLDSDRYGRFYFLDDRRAFVTVKDVAPWFAERIVGQQALLFSGDHKPSATGTPFDRATVIPDADVFSFLEKHRDELKALPPELVPESLRGAEPVRVADATIFRFGTTTHDEVRLRIEYRFAIRHPEAAPQRNDLATDPKRPKDPPPCEQGNKAGGPSAAGIAAQVLEIAEPPQDDAAAVPHHLIALARAARRRALNRGGVWIDTAAPQFAWMDSVDATLEELTLSRLDYLRIRSHVRGDVTFAGDESGRPTFRMFEEMRASTDAPNPIELGLDLYGYQQTGYQWLWFLQQNDFGALLCDDMGLGKTHQAMALICALTKDAAAAGRQDAGVTAALRPVLVVCPTSLLDHWRDKLARYAPDVTVATYYGSSREQQHAQVTLTTYGVVRNSVDEFAGRWYDVVVLDEIQSIKNRATQTYQAVARLERRIAVGLTGTPLENRVAELKALVDYVVPGYLPGDAQFERQYARPAELGDAEAGERLRRLTSPFILRRTKSQVLTELPEKIVDVRHCDLTPEQKAIYRRIAQSKGGEIRARIRAGEKLPYIHVFAALNYLKQVCNHPAILPETLGRGETSGKWNLFTELLDETLGSGLKVVVFSQYVKMLTMIETHLRERAVGFATIKGDTRHRGAEVERFHRDPECRVFTASLRAGGLGIDLTAASVVIHYDRWWNQAREEQATDRVHRIGQNKGVQVIKLITRGTIEEKIDRMIEAKGRLASELVREDDPHLVKQFTPAEIDSLFAYEE